MHQTCPKTTSWTDTATSRETSDFAEQPSGDEGTHLCVFGTPLIVLSTSYEVRVAAVTSARKVSSFWDSTYASPVIFMCSSKAAHKTATDGTTTVTFTSSTKSCLVLSNWTLTQPSSWLGPEWRSEQDATTGFACVQLLHNAGVARSCGQELLT